MNLGTTLRTFGLVSTLSLATLAQAAPLSMTTADFEGNLSAWTERNPAIPTAQIVADPLNTGRGQVLTFQRVGASGMLFGNDAVTSDSGKFMLTFDYLGLLNQSQGQDPADLGGYIGVVTAMNGSGLWVGGTGSHPTPINLLDDGQWHSYSFIFTSQWGNTLRVMAQDWDGSGPVAGNVFFDNITLQAVPEPTSLALAGLALVAAGAARRRTARQA